MNESYIHVAMRQYNRYTYRSLENTPVDPMMNCMY